MGDKSKIEWTDASWTPIRARNTATGKVGWHCEHATPGCVNCYSETLNRRLGTGLPFKPGHSKDIEIFLDEKMLTDPLRWKRPRMIFVCSMTDLFADFVPDEWIDRVFAVMALASQHTYQILTKRAERMRDYFRNRHDGAPYRERELQIDLQTYSLLSTPLGRKREEETGRWLCRLPLPNCWLGVSCEDQKRANERIPHLLHTPAAVRFISTEPLLGPIDLQRISLGSCEATFYGHPEIKNAAFFMDALRGVNSGAIPALDWLIAGGESGAGARPMHPDWARGLRDQCAAADVPFFFKQWGAYCPAKLWEKHILVRKADGAHGGYGDKVYGEHIAFMQPCSKKAAGRLLDGHEHNGMPARP